MYSRSGKLAAELIGTFVVVLVSAATASLSPLASALAYGLVFGALVAALGRISGAHLNPAVTIGYWVTHRFGVFDTLSYWLAQLAGAAGAAYLLRFSLPEAVRQATSLGTPSIATGLTRGPAMLIEGLMTFCLVLALFATTVARPGARYWLAGLAAAIVITLAVLAGGPFTGGAMNPARAFGPALASHHWTYQAVYWIGPLAGGVAAASLYDLLFHRAHLAPPEKTHG